MGRVAALLGILLTDDRPGQFLEILADDAIEAILGEVAICQCLAPGARGGSEEGAPGDLGRLDILADRLSRSEVQADGAVLVAFLFDLDRGLVTVDMEVTDVELAGGGPAYRVVAPKTRTTG